ncbi:MAG: hypothetical protein Q8T13_19860 [Acidobacteriota bacterium]|nr:hypothetical protein [Acidobacteriota bacterium]
MSSERAGAGPVGVVETTMDGQKATIVFMRSIDDQTPVPQEQATFAIARLADGMVVYLYPTPPVNKHVAAGGGA